MQGKIVGLPQGEQYDYEFMVVLPLDDGNYEWYGNYEWAHEAEQRAKEVEGTIVHNVRIAHKQLKREKV